MLVTSFIPITSPDLFNHALEFSGSLKNRRVTRYWKSKAAHSDLSTILPMSCHLYMVISCVLVPSQTYMGILRLARLELAHEWHHGFLGARVLINNYLSLAQGWQGNKLCCRSCAKLLYMVLLGHWADSPLVHSDAGAMRSCLNIYPSCLVMHLHTGPSPCLLFYSLVMFDLCMTELPYQIVYTLHLHLCIWPRWFYQYISSCIPWELNQWPQRSTYALIFIFDCTLSYD